MLNWILNHAHALTIAAVGSALVIGIAFLLELLLKWRANGRLTRRFPNRDFAVDPLNPEEEFEFREELQTQQDMDPVFFFAKPIMTWVHIPALVILLMIFRRDSIGGWFPLWAGEPCSSVTGCCKVKHNEYRPGCSL